MGVLYRILGLAALIGQRLSRTRINFVPLNWALMAGLAVLFAVALGSASEGFSNGTKPKNVSLADIVGRRVNLSQNYVQVSGTLYPEAAIVARRRSKYESAESARSKPPSDAWVPLVNKNGDSVSSVLVELEDPNATGGPPRQVTVTGLLKPIDTKVAKELESADMGDSSFKMDQEHVLVENAKPGNGLTWSVIAIVSGITLATLGVTFLMKYVVFRKGEAITLPLPGPVSAATFDTPEVVTQATGQFFFNERPISQRFLNVPAWLTETDAGEPILVANVDASSRFFGFTTDNRSGLWVIPLGQMAGHTAEKGTLYLGASALPSLRLTTPATPQTGPARTVILSANNDAEREQLITALVTPRSPRASDTAYAATPTADTTAPQTPPTSSIPFDL